ncbi:MAG: autotransporter-associated beta strand repeat-containing protein [Luteolibacter sp.]
MKPKGSSRNLFANSASLTAIVVASFAMPTLHAGTIYWDGLTAGWDAVGNWSTASGATTPDPGAVPIISDDVIFNITSVNAAETISLNANQAANSLTFNNTGTTLLQGNTTASTNRVLTIGAGGITVNSGAGAVTIGSTTANQNVAITLGASQSWINNSSNALNIVNAVTGAASATQTLTLGGTGNTTWAAGNTINAGTSGVLNITKTGSGTVLLGTTSGAANNLGGGTLNVTGGIFNIGARDLSTGGLTGSGTVGNGSSTARWLFVNNAVDNAFSGVLQNSSTAGLGLNKSGVGNLTLSGANTYTDTTTVNAGTLTVSSTGSIGNSFINLVGGTVTIAGSTGTGAISVGNGTLNVSGTLGTNTANGGFKVGTVTNSKGIMNIQPGAVINNRLNLFVGDAGGGTGGGSVFQTGGSLILTQAAGIDNLRIGSNSTGYGYYNLSGGTVTSVQPSIGASLVDTVGVVDVTGGTFSATGQLHIAAGSASSSGLLNVTGGAVTAGTDIRFLQVQAGTAGATSLGVLNVGGGAGLASVTTGNASGVGLNLAQTNNVAGATGIANILANGTLNTGRILGSQANATTHLNFNGGTLKATATNSGTTFLTDANIDAVNVYSGGGTINNNNTAITISKGLLAPTGQGVSSSSISVGAGGTGYVGAPLVKLTGGPGTGATGYAVVSGGVVTSIVVTSPGIGYTAGDTLTATFFGGSYTTAATNVTGITVAANTSGGMTFAGGSSGATTLSGTNTYTGATSVSSGKVFINGSLASGSAVAVSSGATLGGLGTVNGATTVASGGNIEAGQSSTGKLTLGGGLTFSGTGNVNFGTLSNYAASTGVNAGAFSLGGAAGAVVINVASLGSATAGNTYTLIDYSGGSIGGTGYAGLSLGALPSRGIGNLVNTGTQVNLALTSLDYLKWTGSNGTAWNTSNTSWKLNSNNSVTSYINTPGDSVVFDDSAGANTVVDVSGADVNPTSVVFNNNTANYTLQGSNAVAGVTSVVKNNSAALTITNANTYSGGTTLNAGTLNINNASAIGTGALTINGGVIDNTNGGVTLTTNNAQNWNGDFASSGTNALNLGTGAVTLGASRTVTTNGTGALTVGGVIGGAGMSLTKNGTGTLILGGVNTYSGGTNLNAGTLQLNQTTGAAATGTINIAGGTLVFNPPASNFGYAPAINLSADATFSKIGGSQINYTGVLTGTGNVVDVSTSASRLYMNGTVSGVSQFNITSGAMGFDLSVGNRGGSAPVNVSSGASLWFANATNAITNNITLNGGTGQGATGALFQEGGGAPIISGTVALASGDSSIGGNTAGAVVGITGQISGSGALTKIGANKYTFSGANTYTGGTTVNAGTLAAGVASVANVSGAFGNNSAVTMGNISGATLDITGFNTQIGSLTGGGTTGGNVTLGAATLTSGGDNTSPAAYGGVISGTGGFTKIGTGTQILTGANSYSGDTTINGGTLIANRGNNLVNPVTSALGNSQTAHNITVNSGGTLNFAQGDTFGGATTAVLSTLVINAGGVVTNTTGNFTTLGPVALNGGTLTTTGGAITGYQSYSFSGDVSVGGSTASTISVTGGGNSFNGFHLGANTTFTVADATSSSASDLNVSAPLIDRNASLAGAGGLTKAGAGTMTLSGTNTYTGATTVNAGKLLVNGNISTSLTTVNSTGILGGSGMIGGLTVAAGGTVSPGNSPGILSAGNTDLQTDSTLTIELNGGTVGTEYDQLNVTGSVSLAGNLSLSLGYTPINNALFFILANDGTDDITGTFTGLADNSTFNVGGQDFKISYFGDTTGQTFTGGNDVVLMAVPEPGAALLGGLGVLALLRRRRSN